MHIYLEKDDLRYTLHYTNNRSRIELRFINSSHLQITVPHGACKKQIDMILEKKHQWIAKQQHRLALLESQPVNRSIENSQPLLYLGQTITLFITYSDINNINIRLAQNKLLLDIPKHKHKISPEQAIKDWYIKSAVQVLTEKTSLWAEIINLYPKKITIKDQKTRWGSCSSLGNINYNWRLIMAPAEVIDYIVVHELCHLAILNHSAKYWSMVASYNPEFPKSQTWLRDNSLLLNRLFNKREV